MELRKLKSDDIFPMIAILSKIGFKDLKELVTPDNVKELKALTTGDGDELIIGASVMMDFVSIIMKNLPSCKKEIYTFLSGLSGMTTDEIGELDIAAFTEMIIDVFQKEEFKDFFKVVSRLFK